LLFAFIQYIESQVVLFDSVEDAAFDQTHDLTGKGSVTYLTERLDNDELKKKLLNKAGRFQRAYRAYGASDPVLFGQSVGNYQ
jgi:phosphoenolpyruvate carboxylase